VAALAEQVAADGGEVLASYRDPLGARWVLLAALPLEAVEATPYQRELSEAHAKRLADVIPKVGRYLDPLIALRRPDGAGYWTPNGMHRLEAMRRLGAKSITALLVPEPEVAYRILALNTEKAHALKDKSLEAIRMARSLAGEAASARRPEEEWAFEFEEPAYLTLGLCYEENRRFAGSAYLPVVRRCDAFSKKGIASSLAERAAHAEKLLELDQAVNACVKALKERGLQSPYLKPFVVARINPLRWAERPKPGKRAPRADMGATLGKMLASAKKFDPSRIRPQDLSHIGGPPPEE